MKLSKEKEKWVLLVVLTLIWGSSFILIKKSLLHYNPYEVGSLRIAIASVLLMPLAIINIRKFPRKQLKYLLVAAACGNFIPMFLFPMAETEISSAVAGIINSVMPIFVIILGALFWNTKTTKQQIIGTVISFSGVCILTLGGGEAGELKIIPILLLLLATLLYAINSLTVKTKLGHVEPKALSAFVFGFVLFVPSLIALVFAGFFRDFSFSKDNFEGLVYVSMLSVFGTGLAMMLNYRLLSVSSALFSSTVTLLMPIVAIIWGIIDGEELSVMQFVGAAVIIAGLIFLRGKTQK
ncbi:Uncharacterized inner membrane transporter yiJE [Chryseobacterium taklimakanense]|uniref:Uncharacterized inner membrane transporter yiJE n=1 Tax=Chryseobacterium taklimakanense TaxID=536441 RepID=A0A239XFL3_9FLAO|nr:DMT family transporter [Chryseobacterium taklimakanense]SNV45146.1 Uncharacterized inner membrane transporter yiJE [Chryseobacterium taklimakanense]